MGTRRVSIPLVEIDIGLLAHQVGVTATDTLYLGQGVHDLLLTVDIGVEKTELGRRGQSISNLNKSTSASPAHYSIWCYHLKIHPNSPHP